MSHPSPSLHHRRRLISLAGAWVLLLSLVMPLLVGQNAAATAPPDDDSGAQQTPCDSGFRLDAATNACVPIELDPSQIDPPELDDPEPRCLAGMVVDPTTGQCVPAQPDDQQQGCGPGLMPNPNTDQCVPEESEGDTSDCDVGTLFDPDAGNCVPAQPADELVECDEGTQPDPNIGACVPLELPTDGPSVSVCGPGMEFEPRSATCLPAGATSPCPTGTFFDPASGDCTSLVPPIQLPDCDTSMEYDLVTGDCRPVNKITITKYACPEGTAHDATLEILRARCTTMAGVAFVREGIDEGVVGTSGSNGMVTFSSFEPGAYMAVRETIPEGYGHPVIFCWSPPSTSGPNIQDASDMVSDIIGGLRVNFPDDTFTTLECDWFNLLAQDRGVHQVMYKWYCPAGTRLDHPEQDQYLRDCGVSTGGEVFNAVFGGTPQTQTTLGSTRIHIDWGEVEIGPWQVTEEIPDGYGEPVVFCRYYFLPTGSGLSYSPVKMTVTEGAISGVYTQAHRGASRVCNWFNIPLEPEAHLPFPSAALELPLPGAVVPSNPSA